jgi:hypothetical protein
MFTFWSFWWSGSDKKLGKLGWMNPEFQRTWLVTNVVKPMS